MAPLVVLYALLFASEAKAGSANVVQNPQPTLQVLSGRSAGIAVFLRTNSKDRVQVLQVKALKCEGSRLSSRQACDIVVARAQGWFEELGLRPPCRDLPTSTLRDIRARLRGFLEEVLSENVVEEAPSGDGGGSANLEVEELN